MSDTNMLKATCKSMFCHQCLCSKCFHLPHRDTKMYGLLIELLWLA